MTDMKSTKTLKMMFFRILTDVAKAPSLAAYKESQKLKAEKSKLEIEIANRAVECGTLEGLQILPGGFLSSDRTMLETSTGFIEVRGVVSGIKKGSRIWQLRDNIHLEGSRRHFNTY